MLMNPCHEPIGFGAWIRIVAIATSILVAMELHKALRRRAAHQRMILETLGIVVQGDHSVLGMDGPGAGSTRLVHQVWSPQPHRFQLLDLLGLGLLLLDDDLLSFDCFRYRIVGDHL